LVTLTVDGDNELGTLGIALELLTQAQDVRVHRARGGKALVVPHLLEQPLAGDDLSAVLEQVHEQIELLARERDLAAAAKGLTAARAHAGVPERELLDLVARPRAAQDGAHARQPLGQ